MRRGRIPVRELDLPQFFGSCDTLNNMLLQLDVVCINGGDLWLNNYLTLPTKDTLLG